MHPCSTLHEHPANFGLLLEHLRRMLRSHGCVPPETARAGGERGKELSQQNPLQRGSTSGTSFADSFDVQETCKVQRPHGPSQRSRYEQLEGLH